jgi:hypothetical protein
VRISVILGVAWLLLAPACGGSGGAKPGSVPLGGACRGLVECAPVAGKVVRCDCTDRSRSPLCVADLEAGESCALVGNFQTPCRAGTDCSGPLAAPVCVARVGAGEPCGNDAGLCQDPYYCDGSGHCALGQAKLGEDCSFIQDASCAAPNLCGNGAVCTAPARLGESCIPGDRNPCAAGSVCNGGTCVKPAPDGADCFFDADCASGVCSLDQCGPGPLPAGIIFSCGI